MVLQIRLGMMLALPFLPMALMLGAQGMAVNGAPLRPRISKKEIQEKARQVDEGIGCEAYRADFDMYAVCKKKRTARPPKQSRRLFVPSHGSGYRRRCLATGMPWR
jgi:hypothetical protein